MERFAQPMARLIEELRKLPGIGAKSAQRLAFHILRAPGEEASALAQAIQELRAKLRLCSVCNNVTDVDPCVYCSSPTRTHATVCVVEEPTNISAIEKTRSYNGIYHVLHGTLSPLNGIGPSQLRTANLFSRLGGIEEIILALSPTVEGEATSHWLAGELHRAAADHPLRITRIATGIPAGSDIEYADEVTMSRALEGRREL
ncbi:recombination mediator RecR [Terriglobus roseus]|uniref:Recombination protein RecR n=1 Tax=Terriglobus roseus TaxID=392734 RepID=A0A1G7I227_9BACT|nr:recombination mediator RecR [Terriglobus roseus]SDF06633.1 DNA replication and repair protein RecR [Terriglobus roseus]